MRVWLPLGRGPVGLGWLFQSALGPHGLARLIGLLLGLIELAGAILSGCTLGRSLSVAPKATALVTSGIYSRIGAQRIDCDEVHVVGDFRGAKVLGQATVSEQHDPDKNNQPSHKRPAYHSPAAELGLCRRPRSRLSCDNMR